MLTKNLFSDRTAEAPRTEYVNNPSMISAETTNNLFHHEGFLHHIVPYRSIRSDTSQFYRYTIDLLLLSYHQMIRYYVAGKWELH